MAGTGGLPGCACLDTSTVRVILPATTPGVLTLVTTDQAADAAALVTRCAVHWSIEQAFADARNVPGTSQR